MRRQSGIIALLLTLAGLPLAAAEPALDAVLGSNGEVFLARSGRCGELFTDCGAAAGNRLLAIEIQRPGEQTRRVRVPGTAGPDLEGTPALVYQDAAQSLFVVWESKPDPLRSRLNLAWYKGNVWSEVFEVSGNIVPLKNVPRVRVTHDRFQLPRAGGADLSAPYVRTIVHVAWWEQSAGQEEVFYTPIVLENGTYIGRNEVYSLSALETDAPPERPTGLPIELTRTVSLDLGSDGSRVIIGFTSRTTERFVTFEALALPGEISWLADDAEAAILTQGAYFNEAGIQHLAEHARGHMIEIGQRLHPALLNHLADSLAAEIRAVGTEAPSLSSLADRARGHMIEIGARFFSDHGLSADELANLGELIEVRATAEAAEFADSGIPHQVSVRQVDSRPAPAVGAGPIWLFVSEEGKRAIVGWVEGNALRYRETLEEGQGDWSPVRRIVLAGTIDASRAQDLLRRRVRDH